MTPRITLLHGWGYDATLWRRVQPLLAGFELEVADLGYFGAPVPPAPCAGPRIAVGHSLGALWWLGLTSLPWTRLVAINGFARFTAAADFPQGAAPRVLARMQKRFAAAPDAVLADFRHACGAAGPILPRDTAPLAAGLATLAQADARAQLHGRRHDVFAIAARDDAIVPPAMSEATFAALPATHLHWNDDGGHLMPLTHPEACADLIRAVAA